MIETIISGLLWFSAVACGLLAGVYFAFSTFIMTALGRVDRTAGLSVMNAINATILRSLFMPLFFGSTLASLVLAVAAVFRWGEPGATPMLAGGVVSVIGMFLCTVVFNVPLNNALAAADPAHAESGAVWTRYLREWTAWNHVRTIASTLASVLFLVAIAAR